MIIDARNLVTKPEGNKPQSPASLIGFAVHHTVGGNEVYSEDKERGIIAAIDAQHVSQGYGGFGYHYIVFASGRAYWCGEGQRAHVAQRNHELRGVALHGTFTSTLPGEAQWAGLREILLYERATFGNLPIKGHKEWALPGEGTACPGVVAPRDWEAFLNPQPARKFIAGDADGGLEVAGNQLLVWNNGVCVLALGDFEGQAPGQIAKLFGENWRWLRQGENVVPLTDDVREAVWSTAKGD